MDTTAKFWERIANYYARRPVADEVSYQKKLAVTREYLRPDMQVLELGSGTGTTALLHAPYVKHIRALDISNNMLAIANKKKGEAGVTNVSFEQHNIQHLDEPDATYDAVLTMSLLHLLKDKESTIAQIYEALKPGGVFVSSTACMEGFQKVFNVIGPIGHFFGLLPVLRVFSAKSLVAAVERAGFSIDYHWRPGPGKALFLVAKKPL